MENKDHPVEREDQMAREGEKAAEDGFLGKNGESYTYQYWGKTFEVNSPKTLDGFLSATVTARNESGARLHRNTFNLSKEKCRVQYQNKIDPQDKTIAKALLAIEDDLTGRLQSTEEAHPLREEKTKVTLSEDEQRQAKELLSRRDLIDVIRGHLDVMGLVGEYANKLILFLVVISRLLNRPNAAIVKGSSAGGKSQLINTIVLLVPPESVMDCTSMSEHALVYMERDQSHKVFVIAEIHGAKDDSRARLYIRELLSRGEINHLVVLKVGDILQTKKIDVHGPIALLESTTQNQVHEENETRYLNVTLDESHAQTKLIQNYQSLTYTEKHLESEELKAGIIHLHHCLQRYLKPAKVIIPFAPLIVPPTDSVRGRRDHAKCLQVVATVALLYQLQRKTKTIGDQLYVFAEPEDYRLAHPLLVHLAKDFTEINSHSRTALDDVSRMVQDGPERLSQSFTYRDVARFTRRPISEIRKRLEPLIHLEYIEVVGKGPNNSHFLRLKSDTEELAANTLLTPDELELKINEQMDLSKELEVENAPQV